VYWRGTFCSCRFIGYFHVLCEFCVIFTGCLCLWRRINLFRTRNSFWLDRPRTEDRPWISKQRMGVFKYEDVDVTSATLSPSSIFIFGLIGPQHNPQTQDAVIRSKSLHLITLIPLQPHHQMFVTTASRRVLKATSTSVCSNYLAAFFPMRCMSSIPSTMKVWRQNDFDLLTLCNNLVGM
jgi:hypothetical protein